MPLKIYIYQVSKKKKMKKIIIELSDEQHAQMMEHLRKNTEMNIEAETFSGYSISLCCVDGMISSWVEVEMNTKIDLGEVNWEVI